MNGAAKHRVPRRGTSMAGSRRNAAPHQTLGSCRVARQHSSPFRRPTPGPLITAAASYSARTSSSDSSSFLSLFTASSSSNPARTDDSKSRFNLSVVHQSSLTFQPSLPSTPEACTDTQRTLRGEPPIEAYKVRRLFQKSNSNSSHHDLGSLGNVGDCSTSPCEKKVVHLGDFVHARRLCKTYPLSCPASLVHHRSHERHALSGGSEPHPVVETQRGCVPAIDSARHRPTHGSDACLVYSHGEDRAGQTFSAQSLPQPEVHQFHGSLFWTAVEQHAPLRNPIKQHNPPERRVVHTGAPVRLQHITRFAQSAQLRTVKGLLVTSIQSRHKHPLDLITPSFVQLIRSDDLNPLWPCVRLRQWLRLLEWSPQIYKLPNFPKARPFKRTQTPPLLRIRKRLSDLDFGASLFGEKLTRRVHARGSFPDSNFHPIGISRSGGFRHEHHRGSSRTDYREARLSNSCSTFRCVQCPKDQRKVDSVPMSAGNQSASGDHGIPLTLADQSGCRGEIQRFRHPDHTKNRFAGNR